MNRNQIAALLSSSIACAALLALLWPARVEGFVFLGGSLDLTRRSVRVFNNFSDPESNNNTTPDPSFPGAIGAPLAIWKACVEWQSELHGGGNGDPTQPGGLGSGGANFDFSWQGLANSPGRPNENIVSEIAGSSLGVVAFTETPIQDGWRIRFYRDAAVWHDGPGAPPSVNGHSDIQGVATHELGHALGLDHPATNHATMFPFSSGNHFTEHRTLEADDIAGIQALYGVRSATKPHIASYVLSSDTLSISGSHFAATGNEVWFTSADPLAFGTPFKVSGLVSSAAGTLITLPTSSFEGRGDMLVKVPGSDGSALSNAYPFDPWHSACPEPSIYGQAKPTSIASLPTLSVLGSSHLSTHDLAVQTDGGIPDAFGILISGAGPNALPFAGGELLVSTPLMRHGAFQFDFVGAASVPITFDAGDVGTTRCYQLMFHDAGDASGVGLSNAVQVSFCP